MALRLLQRGACRLQPALLLGTRAESTAAAAAVAPESSAVAELPGVGPVQDPFTLQKLQEAINMEVEVSRGPNKVSESERAQQLALLRLHNSAYNLHGQLIRARVLDMDRKKIVVDTGIKVAKIAHSDIRSECVIGTTNTEDAPRQPEEVRVGDIVQVFLESVEGPEGGMMVSGQQAARERRFHAVWKELEERWQQKRTVPGRILNQLSGGYAVGIGGLVAFMPAQACHPVTASRIGKLQDFVITGMYKSRQNVVVRDAHLDKLLNQQVRAARVKAGLVKPRGQENPEQISQAAEELRSLLASKSTRP